jgi:hypothetical protein
MNGSQMFDTEATTTTTIATVAFTMTTIASMTKTILRDQKVLVLFWQSSV